MNNELPHSGHCKTRNISGTRLYYCMVSGDLPGICHHAMTFGDDYLCLYPCNHLYAGNHGVLESDNQTVFG